MRRPSVLLLLMVSRILAQAPTPDVLPGSQPDLQTLAGAARGLRRTASVSDEVKAKADKLMTEAQAQQVAGSAGEARRRYANAVAILKGQEWGPKQELAWSLALRPDTIVADSNLRLIARVSQTYPAPFRSAGPLKINLSLAGDTGQPKSLGAFDLPARDLIDQPFAVDADLAGVADGAWTFKAEIPDLVTLTTPIQVVKGIATSRAALEARLGKITGHDSTKATVRYPYVLAETVNAGRRQLSPADFGLPFQPQLPYNFAAGVKNSAEVLKALEAGKDPLWRARGDHERHYWFADANEMMAYRVYVPTKWDGKSKLPMVLVLHGNTRDQNYYFDRDDQILGKLAEKNGYLVVCPMGYRPSAGWGSTSLNRNTGRGGRGPAPNPRIGELSEKDGLNVFELVNKEYPIDPARTYLFGHSAGGAGAWYFGEKFPERFAAVAMSAAPTSPDGFPFDRLKGIPLMIIHGDADTEVPIARSQAMLQAAKENGLDPQFVVIPGATHGTIVGLVEPQVFEFFGKHHK